MEWGQQGGIGGLLGEPLFPLTSPPQAQMMKVSNLLLWHQNTILPILSTPTFSPSTLWHTVCFLYFFLPHCSLVHLTICFCLVQPLCPQDHYCVVEQCVVATKYNNDGYLLTPLTIKNILTTRIKLECFYCIDLELDSSLITSQVQISYILMEWHRWV